MDTGLQFISAPVPPEVSRLNMEELEGLAECEELLDDFVQNLPQLAALTQQCDKLAVENTELAKTNLSLNSEYESTRDRTLQGVEALTGLHQSFEELTLHSQALTAKLQPSCLQENMSIAAAQSEEESENIAEKFLDEKIDVDTFLKTYLDKRIEAHLRTFKGDRLGAQLIELQKAGFWI